MKCVGEDFERIDEPRAGAAEIGRAVDDVDTFRADARQVAPAWIAAEDRQIGEGALDVEAAAGDEHHVRRGGDDLLPIERARALARDADDFLAAGKPDEFRAPVAAGERRVDPFEDDDARTMRHVV